MTVEIAVMPILTASLPLMTGALLAATPWLMRRRECFAVTVPESAQGNPQIRRLKVRYATIMATLTSVVSLASIALTVLGHPGAALVCMFASTLVLCVASFTLMLRYRRKVQALKRERGWAGGERQHSVAVIAEEGLPRPLSLAWNLVNAPVMAVTLVIGIVGYPLMPDMIPMHVDFAGNVTDWEPKGPGTVAFPLIVQAFITICLMAAHWSILRSKKGTDPEAPVASALGYALFARAQSVLLVATGAVVNAGVSLFQLTSIGIVGIGQAAAVLVLIVVALLVASVVVSVIYGQAGSRAVRRIEAAGQISFDDDAHWKLGVFYVNRDDASLFVPERFGIGWTMNFARPAAWAFMAGIAALTVAFVVVLAVLF